MRARHRTRRNVVCSHPALDEFPERFRLEFRAEQTGTELPHGSHTTPILPDYHAVESRPTHDREALPAP